MSNFYNNAPQEGQMVIVNTLKFEKMIESQICLSEMQFICDYDFTLTKRTWMHDPMHDHHKKYNGSSYNGIEIHPVMDKSQIERMDKERQKYEPFEQSVELSMKERQEMVDEWCIVTYSIIASSNFTRENIIHAVRNQKSICLKERFTEFDSLLNIHKAFEHPNLIIFSAGVGNVITEKFLQEGFELQNKFIYANEIDYETRKIVNKDAMINAFSKNSSILPKHKLSNKARAFIVIGDHIEDHKMLCDEHIPDSKSQHVFRIGLINHQDLSDRMSLDKKIQVYSSNFDAFVINDRDFGPIVDMIKKHFLK